MEIDAPDVAKHAAPQQGPWWQGLTGYHWFVLAVAALGWLFDTMDQQLFAVARKPAVAELLSVPEGDPRVNEAASQATSIFMIGWATGGLLFGVLGDRLGRARTMVLTILIYSICTGLSALSVGMWDFCLYRFITGLGVGGEFAVGVALVAEVIPDRARPQALGWVQASSGLGNMVAGLLSIFLGTAVITLPGGGTWSPWRVMFLVGTLPAFLAIVLMRHLQEPERWRAIAQGNEKLGSWRELFGTPRWRKNAVIGMLLAFSGVVGLWGIGFFSFDFVRSVFRKAYEEQGMAKAEIDRQLAHLVGYVSLLQNLGGFLGIWAFSRVTHSIGRKPAFAISFVLAILSTAGTFWFLSDVKDVFWMIPLMGFCQLTLFGGYAIYFPELFPTRLRSTGISFCYNVGRFIAAVGPYTMGRLSKDVFGGYDQVTAWRYTGVAMCAFFLIGLAALPWAPETRGQPLPE
jgi:MFS family permease